MTVCTLRTGMLIVLYLSMIIITIAAYDKPLQELVANKPKSQYQAMIGAVIAVIVSAVGIHGVYTERRVLLLPFIFYTNLVTVFSLVLLLHIMMDQKPEIPRKYVLHCSTSTILGCIFTLISYFNYHKNERRKTTSCTHIEQNYQIDAYYE